MQEREERGRVGVDWLGASILFLFAGGGCCMRISCGLLLSICHWLELVTGSWLPPTLAQLEPDTKQIPQSDSVLNMKHTQKWHWLQWISAWVAGPPKYFYLESATQTDRGIKYWQNSSMIKWLTCDQIKTKTVKERRTNFFRMWIPQYLLQNRSWWTNQIKKISSKHTWINYITVLTNHTNYYSSAKQNKKLPEGNHTHTNSNETCIYKCCIAILWLYS